VSFASPYVLRETGGNLARNIVMTVAAVVTMAVSLTALGGVLIMRQAINQATVQYQGGVELVVFINAGASAQEITGLRQQLAGMVPEEIRSCHFVDQAAAYAEFKSMFSGQPDMLKVMTVQKMPPSFRCVPAGQSAQQAARCPQRRVPGPGHKGGAGPLCHPAQRGPGRGRWRHAGGDSPRRQYDPAGHLRPPA
jgi:cell division transport system permease protein